MIKVLQIESFGIMWEIDGIHILIKDKIMQS